jgi:type IV pilus assembly protein PilY1
LEHANVTTSDYYKLIAGTLNWPAPVSNNVTTIDDLWHTAVNGRGQYFGAKNATDLTSSLSAALMSMGRTPGAGARPTTTKNMASDSQSLSFSSTYTTVDWTGEVTAYTVKTDGSYSDPLSGTAQSGVDSLAWRSGRTSDARNIYYARPNTTTLRSFTYTNLNADGLGGNFTNFCSKTMSDTSTVAPLQCAGLTATQVTAANDGNNMVNYLRGYSANEESNTSSPLYRGRLSALGDIVNSAPTYVAAPSYNYADSGYAAFKTAQASRKPMLYVGSNDGMLHAFSADPSDRGTEMWAFVPTAVMPRMARLANTDYANRHIYLVDGSPNISDVKIGGVWKTILVGGLNGGGKSYYALDVTNPSSPQLLWEYFETATATALSSAIPAASKDADLGYTYGNPLVVKRANGTWVVVFASGYNNTGNGYLYVLDAGTGAQLVKLPTYTSGTTPAGTLAKPSGLARIRAWGDAANDATAKRFYGGDLLGNVWRFDIDGNAPPTNQALRLAYLQIDASTPQPIMARPELALITYNSISYPVVIVGTGQYLGASDLTTSTKQSIYAIRDPLTASGWGDVRANSALVNQVITTAATGTTRTTTNNTVNWASALGWRVDLETPKERIFANMSLYSSILVATSIIPGSNSCAASGGAGWIYLLDISTGSRYPGTDTIRYIGDPQMPGPPTICDGGKICFDSQTLGGGKDTIKVDPPPGSSQKIKRATWRELIN